MQKPLVALIIVFAVVAASCAGASASLTAPTSLSSQSPSTAGATNTGITSSVLAGRWAGTSADSTSGSIGSVLGIPTTGSMGVGPLGTMTWMLTQNGNSFTGTVGFAGITGAMPITVGGTLNGNSGTFTITLPPNAIPLISCSGNASGSFTVDTTANRITGNYAGTTTCTGPFSGPIDLTKK